MTAFEIRKELANRYNLEIHNVCCYHCKYWGFNCGKVLNSYCESRCTKRKKRLDMGKSILSWLRSKIRKVKEVARLRRFFFIFSLDEFRLKNLSKNFLKKVLTFSENLL